MRTAIKHRAAVLLICLAAGSAYALNPSTEKVLENTSKAVSEYLEQVSDVRCTEEVSQLKLRKNGKTEYTEQGTYDYLVLMEGSKDDFLLNESRLPQKQGRKPGKNTPMLISNGFSDLFLIFHPYYHNSFEFEDAQEQIVDGQRLVLIRFTHIPGTRTPAALAVRGREFPLELVGQAWIEPETGSIARIEATVSKDMQDVGLRSLKADVTYSPVPLPGWQRTYRFPAEAIIDVETLRQHWRNIHRFSKYQRFTVDTEVAVSKDMTPKGSPKASKEVKQ
jgi:hypothetical protein